MKCYAQSVQEALEFTIVNRFWRVEKGLFGAQNGTFWLKLKGFGRFWGSERGA